MQVCLALLLDGEHPVGSGELVQHRVEQILDLRGVVFRVAVGVKAGRHLVIGALHRLGVGADVQPEHSKVAGGDDLHRRVPQLGDLLRWQRLATPGRDLLFSAERLGSDSGREGLREDHVAGEGQEPDQRIGLSKLSPAVGDQIAQRDTPIELHHQLEVLLLEPEGRQVFSEARRARRIIDQPSAQTVGKDLHREGAAGPLENRRQGGNLDRCELMGELLSRVDRVPTLAHAHHLSDLLAGVVLQPLQQLFPRKRDACFGERGEGGGA